MGVRIPNHGASPSVSSRRCGRARRRSLATGRLRSILRATHGSSNASALCASFKRHSVALLADALTLLYFIEKLLEALLVGVGHLLSITAGMLLDGLLTALAG